MDFAENLVKSSNELPYGSKIKVDDAINFDTNSPSHLKNVGTANAQTISSSTSTAQKKTTNPPRKSYRPETRNPKSTNNDRRGRSKRAETDSKKSENLTDPSYVPIDLSNYSKPSRLDIVLPEYIVDHVDSFSTNHGDKEKINSSEVVSQVIKSEENRAAEHKELENDVKKVVDAMKSLEESYKFLYDQIETAKKLFPESNPTRKALDDVMAKAATPESILKDGLLTPSSTKITDAS